MSPSDITKRWNYCNVLRDDGMSYGDYVEQLTYLLFLKMADERTQAPYHQPSIVPQQYSWSSLIKKDGDELFDHYRHALDALGKEEGLLGLIFNKAQNKFDSRHPWRSPFGRASRLQTRSWRVCQDPAKLRCLLVSPVLFDTATNRSVQGSINIARQDLQASVFQLPNVMDVDPLKASVWLNQRPVTVRGKFIHPDREMLQRVEKVG